MRILTLMTLLCCVGFSLSTQAQPLSDFQEPLSLEQEGDYSLGMHSVWLEDPSQQLTPQQAMDNDQWQASNTEHLNFGFSNSAFWLASRIQTSDLTQWALWNKYALIDLTEVWLCPLPMLGVEDCNYLQIGDQLPFSLRQHNHPTLILPLAQIGRAHV